ncbi:MAG: PEP/pyruvate-binding domain-containing protein, partial [Ignavibacteriaceae bacterium]|nr:PEP/pyruvate-binding domain-containing protein [Ignavibacteriaceae bacterium]
GKLAEAYLLKVVLESENKFLTACSKAQQIIPFAQHPFEVVMPRLEAIRIFDVLNNVIASIGSIIPDEKKILSDDIDRINEISLLSLRKLRDEIFKKISELVGSIEKKEFLRHLFRQINRVDLLLGTSPEDLEKIKKHQKKFELEDKMLCEKLADKFALKPQQGALELVPLIGWKAANLAELDMVGGEGLIPSWFVVTDKAFQTVLQSRIKENFSAAGETFNKETLVTEVIDKTLIRADLSNRDKSSIIKNLWETISLPDEIKNEVIEAYHEIEKEFLASKSEKEKDAKLYVAIRSSSCEEDAEIAARAGEFETYLFINGEELLIQYLKRTWSGLWTERAIHNRNVFGSTSIGTKGGVIVQRIVWSRISGVLQTINVPKKDLKEIVINAGLGLGEGVVSGAVAADQIIVVKEGNLERGPLKFNYITADKNEQVVFNKNAGYGTVLSSTLYHQRFRPALEYVELCELVSVASKLESAYGYPIDIEFGIEGTKLWLLQVRPVATFLPALNETLKKYPLVKNSESQRRN